MAGAHLFERNALELFDLLRVEGVQRVEHGDGTEALALRQFPQAQISAIPTDANCV